MFHLISEADLGFTEAGLWTSIIGNTKTTIAKIYKSKEFTQSITIPKISAEE